MCPLAKCRRQRLLIPQPNNNNPDYIAITGSVEASAADEIYTITIDINSFFPADMQMGPMGGFAVFIVAQDADGAYSSIYKISVN